MKTELLSISGEKLKEIELPKVFSEKVRADIIQKIFEVEKRIQPYAPDPRAGRKHSASGIVRHKRHAWKVAYGRGISRVPRKTMWRRGTQFYWIGAEVSSTRGGRRAHGPKLGQFTVDKKINRKEQEFALRSAISSTTSNDLLKERYDRFKDKNIKLKLPLVVESKITTIKTKQLIEGIKKILGETFEVAKQEKSVRAGRGKLRGRKYKKTRGLLIITGNNEKLKTTMFDVKKVLELKLDDFYPLGRLAIYTEKAISDLNEVGKKKND